MWLLISCIFILVIALIIRKLLKFESAPDFFPPGPKGLPFIGTFILREDYYIQLRELAKKYGPVFSYKTFGTRVVVLSDLDSTREILVKQGEKLIDRPLPPAIKDTLGGNYGK